MTVSSREHHLPGVEINAIRAWARAGSFECAVPNGLLNAPDMGLLGGPVTLSQRVAQGWAGCMLGINGQWMPLCLGRLPLKMLGVLLRVGAGVMDDAIPMVRRRIERVELQRCRAGIDDGVGGFAENDAIATGYLDDIEIKTEDAEIKIDGNKATVYPVDIEGTFGTVTLELVGELRDGKYMLTTLDAFGI